MNYINIRKKTGTCPGTPNGSEKGQLGDTNNNVNNNYIYILNKYKGNPQNWYECMSIMRQAKADDKYDELSEEDKRKLQFQLMAINR